MSALSSAARVAESPAGRRARPPLAVVPDLRPHHGRSAFVALVVTVLALGLAALLAMNTVLAQDAFVLHNLQQQQAQLTVTEQALAARVAGEEDPARLAAKARALGMRQGGIPVFLQLPDGRILGGQETGQ